MSGINDGFGGASPDDLLAEHEGWILHRSRGLCQSPTALSRIEDVRQEGRIALWQGYRETGDLHQSLAKAFLRMKAIAWHDRLLTGQTPRAAHTVGPDSHRGHTVATGSDSIDAMVENGVWDMLGQAALVDDLEIAYHRGEIMAALNRLTDRQRQYVFARFWCGMDAEGMHMNPGIREARSNNPYLRRDILWTGSKTAYGAKRHLAEALAHLRDLVTV